jgi:16S rRNA (guanine527-N7)-methyltransferase
MTAMDSTKFWTVCASNGFGLDREQMERVDRYVSELHHWNNKVNLISNADEPHILERHILHSLAILKYFTPPQKARCMDIGTGGGFPGIPLKIARPDLIMTLVDSIAKKIKITDMMGKHTLLRDIEGVNARAEALADEKKYRNAFDVIVSRAVAPLVQLISWAEHLMKPTATLITLKGGDLANEIAEAQKKFPSLKIEEHQIELLGAEWFTKQEKKILICTL